MLIFLSFISLHWSWLKLCLGIIKGYTEIIIDTMCDHHNHYTYFNKQLQRVFWLPPLAILQTPIRHSLVSGTPEDQS